ncbi:molybdopterin-guanine dinucleotide biosynthesis protein B [Desulforamulus ferrireducens]|uniref:molybdopterin-guanine dinucleotide biosynthesis protein B n=1 Tax=Desulforamulus ferrireducens TaxID=1833852 RepID=UPI00269C1620
MKSRPRHKLPPVVSLVGCSNSGKTTLIEKLIHILNQRGYRIGTVKHHRGVFQFDLEGKDTWRHAQAGAEMVAMATPDGIGLVKKLTGEISLEQVLSLMSDMDIVIVEGFKTGSQPKIELVRSAISQQPVCSQEELLALVSDLPLDYGVPLYDINNIEGVADLIEERFLQPSKQNVHKELSHEQKKRYHRNIQLPGVGEAGQLKLLQSSVLVVGTGGLGSPVAFYLGAAGIGRLGLIDADTVDYSNLQRQILHSTSDLGRPKVESAREKLLALNPEIEVITYPYRFNEENAAELVKNYDIVVDATDNLATRYIINQACVAEGKPFIYGGVLSMVGQCMTILPGKGPCFRCIFRENPGDKAIKTTSDVGILGSVAGIIGTIQATEVVKYLLGQGELLVGRMLTMDAFSMNFMDVEVKRDKDCPACGKL